MKEFRLEPVNKQVQKMLEEMQVYLQEFEELKDCYISGTTIKICKNNKLTTIVNITKHMTDSLKFTFWNGEPIQNLVFEDVFDYNGLCEFIKIKEPLPHQARKKTLEELGEGNGFYLFDTNYRMNEEAIKDVNCYRYFTITCDNYDEFQNLLKHARALLAIDKEEIKSKVLD